MNTYMHVPPGFRFHPTEEELVDYYLRKKVASTGIDLDVIKDVDLYRIEPWDLQDACKIGEEEQSEWYFFSHKDKKYPTGTRTNRATTAGFWKATGRDKPIHSKHALVGMRKTLVFYKGRAPNGQKSDYIMHEYRLETNENATVQEEGWVVCRVFKKRIPATSKGSEQEPPCWFEDHFLFPTDLGSAVTPYNQYVYPSRKRETEFHQHLRQEAFLQLPQLESPKLPSDVNPGNSLHFSFPMGEEETVERGGHRRMISSHRGRCNYSAHTAEEPIDWRVLDKFVASQLSQDDAPGEQNHVFHASSSQEPVMDYPSTSTSSSQIDLWK